MLVSRRLDRLLRRFHGTRWNALSRAEYRLGGGRGTLLGVLVLPALVYIVMTGITVAFAPSSTLWPARFALIARIVICGAWFWAIFSLQGAMNRMMVLDRDLGVTDAWLMIPMPRKELLHLRLAGRMGARPLMILVLFPLYVVTAAGMPGRLHAFFVCGHLARVGAVIAHMSGELPPASGAYFTAVPLALLASFADYVLLSAAGAACQFGALQQVAGKRLFRDFGRWWEEGLPLFFAGLGLGLAFLLFEALPVGVAGLACYACGLLEGWAETAIGFLLAVGTCVILMITRRCLGQLGLRMTARRFDEVLIRD